MDAVATRESMSGSSGGRLVSVDGRSLPLEETRLSVEARGGLARAVLVQRFRNPYAEPLRVTYKLPLPADGAVAGFAFTVAGERVSGVVEGRAQARERFERALLEGRSAALLEEERSSLFSQEVGNLPPGQEVTCEVRVDQKLAWRPEGAWEWRFPTVCAPRFQGAPGRVPDTKAVSVPVADSALPARVHLELTIRDVLAEGAAPESPSHAVQSHREVQRTRVLLPEGGARLDRDVVVRWRVATPDVGVGVEVAAADRPGHGGAAPALLTVVPPTPEHRLAPLPRDLIVLLDTSGSMTGEPLSQARRVVSALIDSLSEADHLELVAFSDSPRRWKRGAVEVSARTRQEAHAWLASLRASGGTEMHAGILEALRPLSAESQRQVVLVTDGLIGFEREVVQGILRTLPSGARVHTVGVGSGVNRSLTGPAARAGRGVEVVIGLGEDPERAAQMLLSRTDSPQVVELSISGPALLEHAPSRLPDLFAGAPALLSLMLRPEGGELKVSGRTRDGVFTRMLRVPRAEENSGSPALAALFARERVEDLEMEIAGGAAREEREALIERLGVEYQVSTRLTSWVAVSEGRTVDASAPGRTVEMPHELPYGMSVEGLGLRAASTGLSRAMVHAAPMAAPPPMMLGAELQADAGFAPDMGVQGVAPTMRAGTAGARPARERARMKKAAAPQRASPPRSLSDTAAEGGGPTGTPVKRPARTGRARILLLDAARAVVSVTVAEMFVFDPGLPVVLVLSDGRRVTARVLAETSTRPGKVDAGLELRVTLLLPSLLAAGELQSLVLTDTSGELLVTVEA